MPRQVRRGIVWGTVVAVFAFALLATGGSLSKLLADGPFSSDFFDAQAEALLDGRLDVPPEVAGIEGFEHDGRTYLYFGLVPALMRLPIAAVSDGYDGRLSVVSMVAALAVALGATGHLLWRGRQRARGDVPLERWEPFVIGGLTMAAGLSSPLLFLGSRGLVYHEAEIWGTATALAAMLAVLRWWDRPTVGRLAAASLAAAVAMHTRVSVGSGALAALALALGLAWLWRHVPRSSLPALALAVVLPLASYGAVNSARFGEPFSVPFEDQAFSRLDPTRQAALEATGGTLFGPEYAPDALATYLRPDGIRLQALFPWITFREPGPIDDPQFDTVDRSASLPVVAPIFVAMSVAGAITLARDRRRDPWPALATGAVIGLASTVTIAFIAHRYLADFTPALVVLTAIGAWPAAGWLATARPKPRRLGLAVVGGAFLLGLVVNLSLGLQSQRLFLVPEREARRDLVAFQYDLHDRLGGGVPPSVRQIDDLTDVEGQRGDVAILGACHGLYWHDGVRWRPLELGDGHALELEGDLRTATTVATGPGWSIEVEREDGEVELVLVRDGQPIERGEPIDLERLDGRPLVVRVDEVNAEVSVEAGDVVLLERGLRQGAGADRSGARLAGPASDANAVRRATRAPR